MGSSSYDQDQFFKVACQDAARIVSILSLCSADVTKPRENKSIYEHIRDKYAFFIRFFKMVFLKGFTPVVFDMLPYRIWQLLTFAIYLIRLVVLPIFMRLSGFGKYASWTEPPVGSALPDKKSPESRLPDKSVSLSDETRLAEHDFNDPQYEAMIANLCAREAHLSPHSQSPGHPFVAGFPGNFLDHLTGCYKILLAWQQPQFICRAGLYHSVYGTYDYRAGIYDLRDGRDELRKLIGPGAEELAFAICTSDRLGLLRDLMVAMYGSEYVSGYGLLVNIRNNEVDTAFKHRHDSNSTTTSTTSTTGGVSAIDGNSYPRLKCVLSAEGFPVTNHITSTKHILPAKFLANFIVVFAADFMDQGALPFGSSDMDVCLFQFLRYRFFSDVIQFVSPHLTVVPPVFKRYMWDVAFTEPTRAEVIRLKHIWRPAVLGVLNGSTSTSTSSSTSSTDIDFLVSLHDKCPYLIEPALALACRLSGNSREQAVKHKAAADWAGIALQLLEAWGTLAIKDDEVKIHTVMKCIRVLMKTPTTTK